jgi:hypothetical protein
LADGPMLVFQHAVRPGRWPWRHPRAAGSPRQPITKAHQKHNYIYFD